MPFLPPRADDRSDTSPARAPRGSAGRRRRALGVLGLGVVGCLGAAFLSVEPLLLARVAGRVQAVEGGAELLGREGVRLQSGLHDCGPAALANLLAGLGLDSPGLDSLGRLAGTRASGTRLSGLVRAARALGISLASWSPDGGSEEPFPVPAIAWVHRSHFVTVVARDGTGDLEILDPLVGRYRMSPADFRRIWLGEVLLVVQEASPLVATTVAAPFPPRWRFPCDASSPWCSP